MHESRHLYAYLLAYFCFYLYVQVIVCMYMCFHVCAQTSLNLMSMYTSVCICMCVFSCVYVCVVLCTCKLFYSCVCMCASSYTFPCMYRCLCIFVYTDACFCSYVHVCSCVFVCAFVCICDLCFSSLKAFFRFYRFLLLSLVALFNGGEVSNGDGWHCQNSSVPPLLPFWNCPSRFVPWAVMIPQEKGVRNKMHIEVGRFRNISNRMSGSDIMFLYGYWCRMEAIKA